MIVESVASGIIAKIFVTPHCETLHSQLYTLNYHILPFQGVDWGTLGTRRVAAGWLVLPFQGVGNTSFYVI
ncbi:MAG: hypothetical protein LBP87_07170 [Planctomycetaceae bacterium]|nr:hypothetical protein [Planctomycetaceae bacterium]